MQPYQEMELLDAGELSARQFYAQLDNDPLSLDWNGYETDGQEEVFDFSSDEEETAMNVEWLLSSFGMNVDM